MPLSLTLTDYQQEALEHFEKNNWLIVDAPRASGKTYLVKEAVKRYANKRICVLGMHSLRSWFIGLPKVRFVTEPQLTRGFNFIIVDEIDFIPPPNTEQVIVARTFGTVREHPMESKFVSWRERPHICKWKTIKKDYVIKSNQVADEVTQMLGITPDNDFLMDICGELDFGSRKKARKWVMDYKMKLDAADEEKRRVTGFGFSYSFRFLDV